LSGGFFFAYVGIFVLASPKTFRRGVALAAIWTVLYCLSCLGAASAFRTLPAFFPVDRAVILAPGERLRLEVTLSSECREALRTSLRQDDRLFVFIGRGYQDGLDVVIHAGETPLPNHAAESNQFLIRPGGRGGSELSLADSGRLTVGITNRSEEKRELLGWQRGDLPMRACLRLSSNGGAIDRPSVLPAVEVRVVDSHGRVKLAAF
jgi:hypothetical protein